MTFLGSVNFCGPQETTQKPQGGHHNAVCYPVERRPFLEEVVDDCFELFLDGESSKISDVFNIII